MGALIRFLSLHCSATFTAAATRGQTPLADTPPLLRLAVLLPLLLAALVFGAVRTDLRADSVQLRQYDETDSYNGSGVVTFQSGPASDREEGTYSKIFWKRGVGYTNDWRYWILDTYQYSIPDNPAAPDLIAYDGLLFTNLVSHGWSGAALAVGTQADAQRTVQDHFDEELMQVNTVDTNVTSSSTNASFTYNDSHPWLGASYSYTDTNVAPPRTYNLSRVSDVVLITSTNSAWSGSALFKLTADLKDSYQNPITNGYTVASNTPVNGVVFIVVADGSSNTVVSPVITDTNTHTNYSFNITPQRVQLTEIKWKTSSTNDTNWQSGPVYVLKDTTLLFRVSANIADVVWPTNLPAWSNGENGVTQISMTFNTLSTTTNGQLVTCTAGNTVSNQVVVYDFGIVAKGQDVDFSTSHRTLYGVGELVDFTAGFNPSALSSSFPLTFTWSGQGSASTNGLDPGDISTLSGQTFKAGCLPETFTVTATLASGINAGASRTTNVSIIAPTKAILLPIKSAGIQEYVFASNTNVGHTQFTHSCVKKAHWQLEPDTVSFKGLSISEGTAAYSWLGGSTNIPGAIYYGTNWLNADPGNLAALNPHPQGNWVTIGHGNHLDGMYFNVSDGPDTFGVAAGQGGLPTGTYMGQQVTLSPSPAKTNSVSIPLVYRVAVKTNAFTTIESTKVFGPEGSTTIKKDGLGATKGFLEIDSPVE